MAADEIHVGDIGTVIKLTFKDGTTIVDISGAATKNLVFEKPDNSTKVTKAGTFTNSGTDGQLQYTTASGFLDTAGWWRVQGVIIDGSSNQWSSDIHEFKVHVNI